MTYVNYHNKLNLSSQYKNPVKYCFVYLMFRIDAATLTPFAEQLIKSLFGILTKPGSEENSHTMKGKINIFFFLLIFDNRDIIVYCKFFFYVFIAIMRTFFTLKQQIIPLLAELLPVLTDKLTIVARNPSQPEFNHFLFETISFCVK